MSTMLRDLRAALAEAEADANNTDFDRPDAIGPYSRDAAEAYMNGLRDAIGIVERYTPELAAAAVAEDPSPVEAPRRTDIQIIGIAGAPTMARRARVNGIEVLTTSISVNGATNGSRADAVTVTLALLPTRLEFIEPEPGDNMVDGQETN